MMSARTVRWSAAAAVAATAAVAGIGGAGISSGDAPDRATGGAGDHSKSATTILRNAEGAFVGVVHLRFGRQTSVTVWARDVAPGFHGWHVHSVGACDPNATPPFGSAGTHLNPDNAGHGSHAGDLPPLLVGADGTATMAFVTDRLDRDAVFDEDGSAIILHGGSDNLGNIPARYQSTASPAPGPDADTLGTGDAGARFACGALGAADSE